MLPGAGRGKIRRSLVGMRWNSLFLTRSSLDQQKRCYKKKHCFSHNVQITKKTVRNIVDR